MDSPTLLDPTAVASDLIGAPVADVNVPVAQPATAEPTAPAPMPTPDGMVDASGRVFDPSRYKADAAGKPLTYRHANGKHYFLPIGGRRSRLSPAQPPTATPAAEPPPAGAPAQTPGLERPTPTAQPAPAEPATPAWTDAERVAAAAPAAETAPGSHVAAPEPVDCSDDAAEVATRALYMVVGAATGVPEEATPPDAEHKNLLRATAAYVRTTGWRGTPLLAAIIAAAAYLCRVFGKPKSSAWLSAQFSRLFGQAAKKSAPESAPKTEAQPQPVKSIRPTSVPTEIRP